MISLEASSRSLWGLNSMNFGTSYILSAPLVMMMSGSQRKTVNHNDWLHGMSSPSDFGQAAMEVLRGAGLVTLGCGWAQGLGIQIWQPMRLKQNLCGASCQQFGTACFRDFIYLDCSIGNDDVRKSNL